MRGRSLRHLFVFAALGLAAGVQAQEPAGTGLSAVAAGLPTHTVYEDAWRGETGAAAGAAAPYRFSSAPKAGGLQFGRGRSPGDSSGPGPILHVETVPATPGTLMNQRPSHRLEVYRFGPDSSVLLAGKKGGLQVLLRVYNY